MEEVLKKYFKWVFREDFFTVALDYTGCYLFTECDDDARIDQEFHGFVEALGLTNEQLNLCVLDRESQFNYCSYELLGEYIFRVMRHRGKVLSTKEIQNILDTFGYHEEAKIELHEQSSEGTPLYKTLKKRFVPEVLTLDQVELVCRTRVVTLEFLCNLGVPEEQAKKILDVVQEFSESEVYTVVSFDDSKKVKLNRGKHRLMRIVLYWIAEIVCFGFGLPWWIVLIPFSLSVGAMLKLVHSEVFVGSVVLMICFALSILIPVVIWVWMYGADTIYWWEHWLHYVVWDFRRVS